MRRTGAGRLRRARGGRSAARQPTRSPPRWAVKAQSSLRGAARMSRLEYLETQQGQRSERRKRFLRRQRFTIGNHEPKSKNSITLAEQIAFQKAIVQQLEKIERRAYRSKVVLEIDFYSHQDDPPALHT